jgi:hypothetical protein
MIDVVISTVLCLLLQDAHLHMMTSALYISSQELRMAVPSSRAADNGALKWFRFQSTDPTGKCDHPHHFRAGGIYSVPRWINQHGPEGAFDFADLSDWPVANMLKREFDPLIAALREKTVDAVVHDLTFAVAADIMSSGRRAASIQFAKHFHSPLIDIMLLPMPGTREPAPWMHGARRLDFVLVFDDHVAISLHPRKKRTLFGVGSFTIEDGFHIMVYDSDDEGLVRVGGVPSDDEELVRVGGVPSGGGDHVGGDPKFSPPKEAPPPLPKQFWPQLHGGRSMEAKGPFM